MSTPPATRGGRRANAGRKPDQFKKLFDTAAKTIVTQDAMNDLVRALLSQGKAGNHQATVALLDRLLGKVPQAITGENGGPLSIRVVYDDLDPDPNEAA